MSNLAQLRIKADYTQDAVAAALSIDRSTVAKWETGAALPRVSKIPALADLYGCTINDIFNAIQTQEAV